VWVLGDPIGSPRSTLLHLENVRWSEVSAPGRHLRAISIVAPDDVWVLGEQQVWRSEGQSWSRMPLPVAATATATALGTVSRDDAYVAVVDGAGDLPTSIVLHWDGTDWTPVELPPSGSSDAAITSVEASGPNDVWAVGHRIEPAGTFSPLALHWDGTAWTDTEVPQIGPDAAFVDVTTMGPSDAWARVTTAMQGGSPDTHLLRWDGGSWSDDRKHGGDERFSDLASGPSGTWLFTSNRSRFLQRWSGAAWGSTPRLPVDERLTGSMLWHRTSIASVGTGVVVVHMGADGVSAFAYTCG